MPGTNSPWAYQLLHDSSLTDDCPICDRIAIVAPLQGTFSLRFIDRNPFFAHYAMENIAWKGTQFGRTYTVTGSGTFQFGGEAGFFQHMTLQVEINDGNATKLCYFTNAIAGVTRLWPGIDIVLDQTNGTFAQLYTLRLSAAPIRDLWFSTKAFFSASNGPGGDVTFIEHGDLISTSGQIVKRNGELFSSVGIHVPGPDLGLDAVDMLPGGVIAFSLGSSAPSDTLGPIQHGDLLSTDGRILRRNQDLLAPFGIQPPVPDVGLDAVHIRASGEILFSIQSNVFSETLGVMLHRGDLLSSAGNVTSSNQQMLGRFQPVKPDADYGLDALYVWPSGEIWFSTEDDFDDQQLGPISAGDLLSDQGYIVFRQAELTRAFAPAPSGGTTNFGLDAVYVITDATPPVAPPKLSIAVQSATGTVSLSWHAAGRVFQVERADSPIGAFQPLSPIIPGLSYDDVNALTGHKSAYYRLRQW